MLIFPGGGYILLSPREEDPAAFPFFASGYQVFILEYSVGEGIRKVSPESEAAAAVALMRENADELDIDKDKIAVLGFSAGGHLALSIACHWRRYGENARPNAAVLAYPVVTMGEYAHKGSRESLTGNDEAQQKHDFLYWEFHETDQIGVRMDDWKMVVKKGIPHLYNLATDIHEDNDVAAQYPDIVRRMKDIIRTEHRPSADFKITLPSFD